MNLKVLIAGRGGEGIIFLTRVLTEGAWRQGIPVISTETHGMAQRGGSVVSQVKLGKHMSPMLRLGEADVLIATSFKEAQRTRAYLKEGGLTVVNSPEKGVLHIDATALAKKLAHSRGANLILLGAAIGFLGTLNPRSFLEIISDLSPSQWRGKNEEAFLLGLSLGESSKKETQKL